jgi:gamma-glutamylcyclotransferase (GGCT)/AIG2-like uncharacterized protein YtfP
MARLLANSAALVGTAHVRGRLYQIDSYPGLILSDGADEWVKGDIYQPHDPSTLLPVLDDYEGCGAGNKPPFEFERVVTQATLDNCRPVRCWVYVYRHTSRISEERRIASGDFMDTAP